MKKITFALSILLAASAHAANIDSPTAITGGTTITFESPTPGSYTALTLGDVTFTPGANTVAYVDSTYAGYYNTQGQSLANTYANNGFTQLTITFNSAVKTFGFNWGAADTVWTLSAYDANNTLLGSRSLPANLALNGGNFHGLGFATDIAFATLTGVPIAYGDDNDYVFIDNFTASAQPIPEPSTCGLALAGLAMLGFVIRRKAA